jgi:HAAS domain-containing protein
MTMLTLTPDARQHLEQYLHGLRQSLRGTGVEAADVEADVREHIASALEGEAAPVARPVLERVLERLGPPAAWIPDEELPLWRRTVRRLAHGPEEWRLAYLCFGLTVVGALTAPLGGPVLMIAAYFLARSAHALARAQGTTLGARRWLIDPALVLFALPMGVVLFFGPLPAVLVWGIEEGGFLRLARVEAGLPTWPRMRVYAALTAMAAGGWWILVAAASAAGIRAVRALLFPLANGLRPTHLAWLGAAGFVLVATAAASLWF